MEKLKTINLHKLKNVYEMNTKEISLFIFTFVLSSLVPFPLYTKLMLSMSVLSRNRITSSICVILSGIAYIQIQTMLGEPVIRLYLYLILLFIIIVKWISKQSNDYYHNKIIVYCISIFLAFTSDFFVITDFIAFFKDFFFEPGWASTVRAATTFLFVAIIEILLKLPKPKISILTLTNLYFLLNIINYWVYEITHQPIVISDIGLIKTAGTVLNGISVTSSSILHFVGIFIFIILINIFIIKFIKFKTVELKKLTHMKQFIVSPLIFIIFFNYIPTIDVLQFHTLEEIGLIGHLCVTAKTFEEPTNYKDFIDMEEKNITENTNKKKPHVIVIMNEAFSDLSLVSDKFKTSTEYIPYTKSLMKKYPSGITYSSVIGNNTVSSELESLTGIPTGLTTKGAIIYQQVIKDETKSIINEFKDNGYKTIGVHPYVATGYNRGNSWRNLGIDEEYFIDDFKNAETVRDLYVSDEEFYNKIIKLYENNKSEPLFIYGISMQNHSSYNTKGFKSTETNFNDDVNEYVTLSNISDKALKKLINYFESVGEEVVILYYGDHQPMIEGSFYEDLLEKSKKEFTNNERLLQYQIPYILWSNYDLKTTVPKETSMCYLPAILLDSIGFETSSWFEFVNEMRIKYPILTENFLRKGNEEIVDTQSVKKELDTITDKNSKNKYIDLKKYQSLSFNILTE